MLDALEKILDINFQPDIDIDILNLTYNRGEDRFQKDGRTLYLNLDELETEQVEEVLQLPQSEFDADGRVLRNDTAEEVNAIEAGYDDSFDEVIDYFDNILGDRYISIIEDSLYLRSLIEQQDLDREEIESRKRDLAHKYGTNAPYISNLVSAGYFDRNGGLRDLYVEMGLNRQYDRYNFQQELVDLVESKLLCVFVREDQEVLEVTNEVRGRLSKYQREEPIHDWVDIRGIGSSCETIINGTVKNLEEEYIGIDYDRWSEGEATVIRIYPHSLPPIGA